MKSRAGSTIYCIRTLSLINRLLFVEPNPASHSRRVFLLKLLSVELETKSYYLVIRNVRGYSSWELRDFFSPPSPSHVRNCVPSAIYSFATGCTTFFLYSLFFSSSPCAGFPPFPSPTQPSVLLGEDPPPYSPLTSPESGSAPVISCRVCQSLISVEGKIHQHVVKCGVCNEATVGFWRNLCCLYSVCSCLTHMHKFLPSILFPL